MYSIVDVDAATNAEEFTLKPVATGPFIVDSSTDNERVELVANKNYWNGTPKLDSVSYLFIPDANTRMLALQSGEVDVSIGLSASALSTFQDYKNIAVDIVPSTRIIYAFLIRISKLYKTNEYEKPSTMLSIRKPWQILH